jgi:hypothetical protein
VLGVRFADGVVMAGDRRATSGNWISHKTMEKVFPADRFSGVAIAGAAGPAIEMVKLFQLQLEHYEKVEGTVLLARGGRPDYCPGHCSNTTIDAGLARLPLTGIRVGGTAGQQAQAHRCKCHISQVHH